MHQKFKLTFNDYYQANKLMYFQSNRKFSGITLGTCLLYLTFLSVPSIWSIFTILLGALLLTEPYTLTRFIAHRNYKFIYSNNLNITVTITEKDINLITPTQNSKITWNFYTKYVINDQILFLYNKTNNGIIFPKNQISAEDWNKLLEILKTKFGD